MHIKKVGPGGPPLPQIFSDAGAGFISVPGVLHALPIPSFADAQSPALRSAAARGPVRGPLRAAGRRHGAERRSATRPFSEQLREAGIAGSIGTVGDALDNALMESTIGLFKIELIHAPGTASWSSRQHVETATAAWVDWFNHRRLHSSLGHQRPVEYETQYNQAHAQKPLVA